MPNMSFGVLLRGWRAVRHLSQLELALDADISTRHLSCVETGRAQPSREMVLRLAESLQIPLRERNALLLAAGYAPLYRHTNLDTDEAEVARRAVELLMAQLEPYPVLVVDRYWNTKDEYWGKALFCFLPRLPFCNASQRSPPCVPSSGAASFYRKLGECRRTHHSAGASRSCREPVGRNDEVFPRRVTQLPGRPEPLAHGRFGWRCYTVLDHQLQVEEIHASLVFRAYYLRHRTGH